MNEESKEEVVRIALRLAREIKNLENGESRLLARVGLLNVAAELPNSNKARQLISLIRSIKRQSA